MKKLIALLLAMALSSALTVSFAYLCHRGQLGTLDLLRR